MWVLIILAFAINDPPGTGFWPVIQTHEFSTEQTCLAAKDWVLNQLGPDVMNMNKILQDKSKIGEVRDFVAVRLSADCKPK